MDDISISIPRPVPVLELLALSLNLHCCEQFNYPHLDGTERNESNEFRGLGCAKQHDKPQMTVTTATATATTTTATTAEQHVAN